VRVDEAGHNGGAAGIEDWGACWVDALGWPQRRNSLPIDEQAEPALQVLRAAVGQAGVGDQQASDGLTRKRSGLPLGTCRRRNQGGHPLILRMALMTNLNCLAMLVLQGR
jgi:hypothetical protein